MPKYMDAAFLRNGNLRARRMRMKPEEVPKVGASIKVNGRQAEVERVELLCGGYFANIHFQYPRRAVAREAIRAALAKSGLLEILGEHSGEFGYERPVRPDYSLLNILEAYPEVELFVAELGRFRATGRNIGGMAEPD